MNAVILLVFLSIIKQGRIMKTRLARVLDYLFVSIAISLLIFLWLRKTLNSVYLALFVSFTLGFAIAKILNTRAEKKHNKIKLNHEERVRTQKILLHFFELEDHKILEFFKDTFSKKYQCKIVDNHLLVECKTQKIMVFFDFKSEECTTREIMNAYSQAKNTGAKLYYFGSDFSKKAHSIPQLYEDVYLFNGAKTFNVLKTFDSFPKITESLLPNKFKQILGNIISRDKTKKYFTASLFLLMGSIFLPYSLYYQIFASLCMVMTVLSYFQKESTAPLPFEI